MNKEKRLILNVSSKHCRPLRNFPNWIKNCVCINKTSLWRSIFILVTPSFTWLMRVTIGNIKFTFVRFRVNKHIYKMGSGCGSFAKVWQNSCFQYHRYTVQIQSLTKFILNICLLPTNYIEKTKIKKKRPGKAGLKFLFKENLWANPGLFSVYFHPSHITIQLQIEKA